MMHTRGFQSYFRRLSKLWATYRTNRIGLVGVGILCAFLVLLVSQSWIAPQDPGEPDGRHIIERPSSHHLLGTDYMGRDLWSRVIYAVKASLIIGLTAAVTGVVVGTVIGVSAGYLGGIVDQVLMRLTDMFIVMPYIPLMIIMASILGRSLLTTILVISITNWSWTARIVRSETLSIRERPFVERARAIGATDFHIMLHEILPNVTPLVMANAILAVAGAIISAAVLSFIGLGDPTMISWGGILSEAFTYNAVVRGAWWYFVPPGICIVLLSLSFAFIGHALDDVLNPRLRDKRG